MSAGARQSQVPPQADHPPACLQPTVSIGTAAGLTPAAFHCCWCRTAQPLPASLPPPLRPQRSTPQNMAHAVALLSHGQISGHVPHAIAPRQDSDGQHRLADLQQVAHGLKQCHHFVGHHEHPHDGHDKAPSRKNLRFKGGGGDLVPSQCGGGKFGCGTFGESKEHGMRHGACKAQGDGRTKQEAPGCGKFGGQIETTNVPHQIYGPPNPPTPPL